MENLRCGFVRGRGGLRRWRSWRTRRCVRDILRGCVSLLRGESRMKRLLLARYGVNRRVLRVVRFMPHCHERLHLRLREIWRALRLCKFREERRFGRKARGMLGYELVERVELVGWRTRSMPESVPGVRWGRASGCRVLRNRLIFPLVVIRPGRPGRAGRRLIAARVPIVPVTLVNRRRNGAHDVRDGVALAAAAISAVAVPAARKFFRLRDFHICRPAKLRVLCHDRPVEIRNRGVRFLNRRADQLRALIRRLARISGDRAHLGT